MPKLYDRARSLVTKQLDKYGCDIEFISSTNSGTDIEPVYTETVTTVRSVLTNFKPHEVDGDLIQSTDLRLLVSHDAVINPAMRFRLPSSTDEYSIVSVRQVKPDNKLIGQIIQARL